MRSYRWASQTSETSHPPAPQKGAGWDQAGEDLQGIAPLEDQTANHANNVGFDSHGVEHVSRSQQGIDMGSHVDSIFWLLQAQ